MWVGPDNFNGLFLMISSFLEKNSQLSGDDEHPDGEFCTLRAMWFAVGLVLLAIWLGPV
jgi:hypothetical protein